MTADTRNLLLRQNKVQTSNSAQTTTTSMSFRTEFHGNCGIGVLLSNGGQRAARNYPNAEFDNGIVFSKSILADNTIFEVVIEKKTALWSGSLAIGVTLNDPGSTSVIPANVSHLKNGTWVLSGTSVLKDGVSSTDDYSGNLEELSVGDKVGVMRLINNELHFFINGKDMGCAAKDIPSNVFGVVDIYGRCCQVKLCNGDSLEDSEIHCDEETHNKGLFFHPQCGVRVKLSNNRKTVFRPNPQEDFNHGIALTERPLANEEILEVQIEELIEKWAGSLEIGVTTHAPESFELPATMTNVQSGTWILSGCAIVNNGSTVLEPYGNAALFKVGDKLGVCVKSDNTLHFYYNGLDLGRAASDLPSPLYAVVDLYGQAVKATIVNSSSNNETLQVMTQTATANRVAGGTENQETSASKNRLKFSEIHGRLIDLNEDRTGASRLNALTEFNHAVVVSEHPLEDDCLFEIEIKNTTNRWTGSLEVGLLSLAPPDLELPITLTDLNHHTWVLSGRSVMQDGNTVVNGYGVDLDGLGVGARVGVMRKSDGTFHVFINGEDGGTAATAVPPGVFAAIDLYGQCVQVEIVTGDQATGLNSRTSSDESLIDESMLDLSYSFHSCGGESITFRNHGHTAVRARGFNGGLVFSNKPLQDEDIFEVRIDKMDQKWTGSFCIGVTSTQLPLAQLPTQISDLRNNTIFMCGSCVFKDGAKIRGYGMSLDRLQEGSRVGIQRHYDSSLHIYIDSKHKGIVATDIPPGMFGVVDVYGSTQIVSIVNTTNRILWARDVSSDEEIAPQPPKPESAIPELSFHSKCGLNIIMDVSFTNARRKTGFNEGLLFSRKPLANKEMFQVRIDSLNLNWSGSLAVGMIGVHSLEKLNLPATALSFRLNSCTLIHGSQIYINGVKTKFHYKCNFDELREGDRVGVICDDDSRVHIIVNDVDQGFIDHEIPGVKYAILDLYGRCEQVSVVTSNKLPELRTSSGRLETKEQERNEGKQAAKVQDISCENCDYRQRCERFQVTLGIPKQYFTKTIICYCTNCCAARGEFGDEVSGDPPQEYCRPLGWCKFELRLPPNVNSAQILLHYAVAYIGVHVGAIRRTLDRGTVLSTRQNNHVVGGNSDKKILMSPSISRAIALSKEKSFLFTDITSGKRWSTQVAFELRLPSDSCTTVSSSNSKTDEDSSEWCVDVTANVVLMGLLVQISREDR